MLIVMVTMVPEKVGISILFRGGVRRGRGGQRIRNCC